MPTNYEWLLHMDGEERQAWFDAEHVDARFHGATRMTNLERLFVDSEQFRQAVSAFAFAHSDDCPTSPTQMVDWLMAPHEEETVYQSEFTNCGKPYKEGDMVLDSGVIRPIRMVDAQRDNNGTCPNDDETASNHSKAQSKDAPTLSDLYGVLSDANDDLAPESDVTEDAVDANDENATCNNSGDFVTHDSREKLEDKAFNLIARMVNEAYTMGAHEADWSVNRQSVRNCITELFDGVAAITRKTEQAAWIQQANGLIHEANVRADELQYTVESLKAERDYWRTWYLNIEHDNSVLQTKVDELRDELAKRDKGIARLKRQRDTARAKIDELEAECDTCCYKTDYIEMDFYDVDRLEAERDALEAENMALKADSDECVPKAIKKRDEVIKIIKAERDALAADLHDCERQRERLRQALGCAIDHAHEIMALVDIDKEVAR